MRKLFLLCILAVLLLVLGQSIVEGAIPGQLMIDIKHEYLPIYPAPNGQGIIMTGLASIDSLNVLYQVHTFDKLTDDSWSATKGFYFLKFPESRELSETYSSYSSDDHVNLVGYTGYREPDVTPSDYYFPQQWGLTKIKCPEAWRHTNGSRSIIIQIIDGGTDYGHPDLVRNIWQNLGEDTDGDGHTIEWDPAQNRWVLDPGDLNGHNDFFQETT
jgi:subtilisin family serine protease